jgi:hypothetical protein
MVARYLKKIAAKQDISSPNCIKGLERGRKTERARPPLQTKPPPKLALGAAARTSKRGLVMLRLA